MGYISWHKKSVQYAMLFLLAFIWGSSFILMKKGLQSFDNGQVAAMRIFFSFLIFTPIIYREFKHLQRKHVKSLMISGFIGIFFPAFLFTTAQTHINSSLAGMLNSLTPFFALLIGVVFYKYNTNWVSVSGVLVGLLGALGLIVKDFAHVLTSINAYALYIVLATLFYGINTNEIKTKLFELRGLSVASLSFLFIGPFAGVYLLFSDIPQALQHPHAIQSLGAVFILALFSSVVATIIFNVLIKHTTALFAASVTYLIPAFAIVWGLIDGESLTILQIVWISVIMLGVYLVNYKKVRTNGV